MTHRQEFGKYVVSQLDKWGLSAKGWDYCYDENWKKRMGQCDYRDKVLIFSLPFIDLNTIDALKDTVHHEIGHALVGPGNGHGVAWKALAPIVGFVPRACSVDKTINVPAKYSAICSCGIKVTRNRKKPGAIYICKNCRSPITWNEN